MFFPNDVWEIIKGCWFHNISLHGKHFKKDIFYLNYNKVVDELKNHFKKTIYFDQRISRITYTSKKKKYHYIKFTYGVPCPSYYKRRTRNCYLINELIFNFTGNHNLVYEYYKYH